MEKIRGVRTQGVNIFRGIPYAGRISGDRRFRGQLRLDPGLEYMMLSDWGILQYSHQIRLMG
jgi:hypothetical protein